MKKIVLAVVAMSMLATTVAFASAKTNSAKNSAVSSVQQNNGYHLDTYDAQ